MKLEIKTNKKIRKKQITVINKQTKIDKQKAKSVNKAQHNK